MIEPAKNGNFISIGTIRFLGGIATGGLAFALTAVTLHNLLFKPGMVEAAKEAMKQEVTRILDFQELLADKMSSLQMDLTGNDRDISFLKDLIVDEVQERKELEKRFNSFLERATRMEVSILKVEEGMKRVEETLRESRKPGGG